MSYTRCDVQMFLHQKAMEMRTIANASISHTVSKSMQLVVWQRLKCFAKTAVNGLEGKFNISDLNVYAYG